LGSDLTTSDQVLAHGRQVHIAGSGNIVKPDDSQVLWHAQPQVSGGLQHTKSQRVNGHEERRGPPPVRQNLSCGLPSRVLAMFAAPAPFLMKRQPRPFECLPEPPQTALGTGESKGAIQLITYKPDIAMAMFDEIGRAGVISTTTMGKAGFSSCKSCSENGNDRTINPSARFSPINIRKRR